MPYINSSNNNFTINMLSQNGVVIIVDTDIFLSEDTIMGKDTTLIFQGGSIRCYGDVSVTLTGDNTYIMAPICQIFHANIILEGSWNFNKVFPEWFGAYRYDSYCPLPGQSIYTNDSTDAIIKAINFARTGEIAFSSGIYFISRPITISSKISLTGTEGDMNYTDVHSDIFGSVIQIHSTQRTIFIPKTNFSNIGNSAFSMINIEDDDDNALGQGSIRGLTFFNVENLIGNIAIPSAINISYSAFLERCYFFNLPKSIKSESSNGFIKIKGCVFSNTVNILNNTSPALIDITNSSKSISIIGNEINGEKELNRAIRIVQSNFIEIIDNIIKTDLYFEDCKSLDIASLALQGGSTLYVESCAGRIVSSSIEKGDRTPCTVKGSVSSNPSQMQLCNLIFKGYASSCYQTPSSQFDTALETIRNMSEDDMLIGSDVNISIINCFRKWITSSDGITGVSSGIIISQGVETENGQLESTSLMNDFNKDSAFLSRNCNIIGGRIENRDIMIPYINTNLPFNSPTRSQDYWMAESGRMMYIGQIVWEPSRFITTNNILSNYYLTTVEGRGGILLKSSADFNGTLRLIRGNLRIPSMMKCVEIPICGKIELYDNGISINGYKWKDTETSLFQPSNNTITALHIINNTIECYASNNLVDGGDWNINDKFFILGNDNKYIVKLPQFV